MRKTVILLLCIFFTNVINAQTTNMKRVYKGVDAAYEKALKNHQKKLEAERERIQKEEMRKKKNEYDAKTRISTDIQNLDNVDATQFMSEPLNKTKGENSSTKTSNQATTYTPDNREEQKRKVVTNENKNKVNRPENSPYGNSGKIGSPSYSGRNYTGNRYDNKRAGFENTQTHVRVSANHIRGQYKSNRNMRQGVVNLQRTNAVPKAKVQTRQQRNTTQSSQQQKSVQTTKKAKDQQKQQSPVQREKVAWVEGGVKHLDTSKPIYITLQQNNSSSDLATVDSRRIDYATEIGNITVYNMPNEAPSMSDRDNKRPSGSVKGLAHDERTQAQQAQLYAKDVANGMSSFDNRKKWEYIYDYGYDRNVKTPARQATKKR
ncbi:MAG: hypothetical protein IKQ05_02210 [Prevotella sp.]|nr:hypothetical protein [Prevotella sp.]